MKVPAAVAAGFVAGLAFVVACHHTTSAHAGPADCATWQVGYFDTTTPTSNCDPTEPSTYGAKCSLPSGWEPMSYDGSTVYARRCAP
jgi:hypothetical protein